MKNGSDFITLSCSQNLNNTKFVNILISASSEFVFSPSSFSIGLGVGIVCFKPDRNSAFQLFPLLLLHGYSPSSSPFSFPSSSSSFSSSSFPSLFWVFLSLLSLCEAMALFPSCMHNVVVLLFAGNKNYHV